MRIAYLNPSGQLGGAETSLREILASVRAAAPDLDLWLVVGQDGPLADEARRQGVQVVVAPFPAMLARAGDSHASPFRAVASLLSAAVGAVSYQWRLRRILATIGPDIIHTNGFKMHMLGAIACPKNARLIWHIHDYVSARRFMSRLLSLFQGAVSVAIANSNSVAQDLSALAPKLKVVTVYNAVDIVRYFPSGPRLDLDRLAGLAPAEPGTLRVGLVATFARWKGHKVFLDALALVAKKTAIRGYVVGGPIYQTYGSQWSMAELQEHASRLGLDGQLGFTGYVADTAAAMRSLDIIVHASTEPEPFGMVIIEGMACGKPVIASNAGGAAELFDEGHSAISHPPGDAPALASQIERLAADEGLRRRLGQAARSTVERNFQNSRLAEQLLAIYFGNGRQPVRRESQTVLSALGARE